jgi:glycosyltransferase involved in cell wall biosynthesis
LLYICIPVFNEAPTAGLLLWRIRKVFQEYSREYEVLVYDDGSSDATRETLEPYTRVLPLTILGGERRVGYARALDALLREASRRTRYPRRDAIVTMQGDFTDQPDQLLELIKRFEGGADIVVGERVPADSAPAPVRRLRQIAPLLLRPFAKVPGVKDPFSSFRLIRVSVIRDLIKGSGTEALVEGSGWTANVDLLVRAAQHARRVETVEFIPRYDLRVRSTRVRLWSDAFDLFRQSRASRPRWTPPASRAEQRSPSAA